MTEVTSAPSRDDLERAHCWEPDDRVPGRPDMTAFRRSMRWREASWREQMGHPIGTQPLRPRPGKDSRLVGSRLSLEYAERTGANLLTDDAIQAVRDRRANPEPHQSVDWQRLWADLTWSSPLAFSLFAGLANDLDAATALVGAWFPSAPGPVRSVRFLHSPGRFGPALLNSLRDFAVFFELGPSERGAGFVAVDLKFFERNKAEIPKPENLSRVCDVAEASGVFERDAVDHLGGRTEHCVMWLEHLLALAMLQHPSGRWTWGRYVVVHHRANPDVSRLLDSYGGFLRDSTTYRAVGLDELLGEKVLPPSTEHAVRDRYDPFFRPADSDRH